MDNPQSLPTEETRGGRRRVTPNRSTSNPYFAISSAASRGKIVPLTTPCPIKRPPQTVSPAESSSKRLQPCSYLPHNEAIADVAPGGDLKSEGIDDEIREVKREGSRASASDSRPEGHGCQLSIGTEIHGGGNEKIEAVEKSKESVELIPFFYMDSLLSGKRQLNTSSAQRETLPKT